MACTRQPLRMCSGCGVGLATFSREDSAKDLEHMLRKKRAERGPRSGRMEPDSGGSKAQRGLRRTILTPRQCAWRSINADGADNIVRKACRAS